MNRITILYDASCGFCVTCRNWLSFQPKFVEMDFVPARSAESAKRFPGLELSDQPEELTAVADTGEVWKGTKAWLMSLWALVEYREWAERLSSPALMPLARGLFAIVGSQRRRLSGLLGLRAEEDVIAELRTFVVPRCAAEDGIPLAQVAEALPQVGVEQQAVVQPSPRPPESEAVRLAHGGRGEALPRVRPAPRPWPIRSRPWDF